MGKLSLDNRLKFYDQNEALLFQFLLHESLRTAQTLKKKAELDTLSQVIGELDMSQQVWYAPSGHLSKLFHYFSLMPNHTKDFFSKQLGETLRRACETAKKCYSELEKNSKTAPKSYTLLKKEVRNFINILFQKLPEFKDEPSVLYFLLKHQKEFDIFYRKSIIKTTFQNFFPEGIQQAETFFADKFSKKGLDHLLPSIKQILITLKNNER